MTEALFIHNLSNQKEVALNPSVSQNNITVESEDDEPDTTVSIANRNQPENKTITRDLTTNLHRSHNQLKVIPAGNYMFKV